MSSSGWDDYYELLGVSPGATMEEIRAAYRREAKRWHPDEPEGDAERMQALNDARDVLTEPATRADYDRGHAVAPDPPVPRLSPSVVTWSLSDGSMLTPARVRLTSEGGPITTIEPERLSGEFWYATDCEGVMEGDNLVYGFLVVPAGAEALPAGTHRDEAVFFVDGDRAVLTLELVIPIRATPPPPRPDPAGRPRHRPAATPPPAAAGAGIARPGAYLADVPGAVLALLGAVALLGAPFGVMALLIPTFNSGHNLLVDLVALAVGAACFCLVIAGLLAVGTALLNLLRALVGRP